MISSSRTQSLESPRPERQDRGLEGWGRRPPRVVEQPYCLQRGDRVESMRMYEHLSRKLEVRKQGFRARVRGKKLGAGLISNAIHHAQHLS